MITLRKDGARIYFTGDTFPHKQAIKDAGGHWDPDSKSWWIGSQKALEAQQIANQANSQGSRSYPDAPQSSTGAATSNQPARSGDKLSDETVIKGKAQYKGKEYLLLWEGVTSRGPAAKLAFRNGEKTFWANGGEYAVTKRYHEREWRGRTEPGMTFGRLNRLAAEYSQAKKDGIEPCHKCGGIHRSTERQCYMCGCTRCEGASGGLCEDD